VYIFSDRNRHTVFYFFSLSHEYPDALLYIHRNAEPHTFLHIYKHAHTIGHSNTDGFTLFNRHKYKHPYALIHIYTDIYFYHNIHAERHSDPELYIYSDPDNHPHIHKHTDTAAVSG